MRQVIEILRLKHEHHLSIREIARSCGIASSTVGDYLLRAEAAGLRWPLPEGVGETELEARLSAVAPPRLAGTPIGEGWSRWWCGGDGFAERRPPAMKGSRVSS